MSNLAATDITLSLSNVNRHRLGRTNMNYGTMTFGAAGKDYPYGGVPLPAKAKLGFHQEITDIQFFDDATGIIWKYDKTNHKLKAFARAPVVIFEEVVTLTANTTGTTKYPMAWPLYASNGNQALGLLPAGLTPVANTIAINMHSATPGARATITARAADTFSTITISYITQAWSEVFENLVEADSITAGATSAAGVTFAAGTPDVISFAGVGGGYILGLMLATTLSATVAAPKPIYKGETAKAAEYALDWTNTSPAATTVKPLQSQVWDDPGNIVTMNYIKDPGAGHFINGRFIEEDSSSASSQIYTLAGAGDVDQALLLSTPGFIVGPTVSTTVGTWPIGGSGMTLGSTAQWQPTNFYPKQKLTTAGTFTSGTGVSATNACKQSYIWGVPEDITKLVPLELPDGSSMYVSKTLRFMAWGK